MHFLKYFLVIFCTLLVSISVTYGAKSSPSSSEGSSKQGVIEEINSKQFNKLIGENGVVAVFWATKSCGKKCDLVLNKLESIDDKTDALGMDFVKLQDKRLAKSYDIKDFPSLSYFRNKEPVHYEGDLDDEDAVLEFLTSLHSQDNPDRIEEVTAKMLQKTVQENTHVAVLFYAAPCKKSEKALKELENIDDEADELGIAFVKINDEELADEYNLDEIPALVYYRHGVPIVFDGELTQEQQVLSWLISNKNSDSDDDDDEEDVIESVSLKGLWTLIESVDRIVVLFYVPDDKLSEAALKDLESIDDDCAREGIEFVKTEDKRAAKEFGVEDLPTLVYFENKIPNIYDGDLRDESAVFEWLMHQKDSDEIEDVTSEMLERLVKESKHLAVLFYDEDEEDSQKVLQELENIDDECDDKGIVFVKIDDLHEAAHLGIEDTPALVYFENSIPTIYKGDLLNEDVVLKWLVEQLESDEIEEVTGEMLNFLVNHNQELASLFYSKDQRKSQKILEALENIDDECDSHGIVFVKISDEEKTMDLGVPIPSLVYFENRIPHLYEGDLTEEDDVLKWLLHQLKSDEIEEVTDEMLDQLIEKHEFVTALFYSKKDKTDIKILNELEKIDDECDSHGILFVKIDDPSEAKEYGFEDLPVLVYFENRVPSVFEGDLNDEDAVLKWLVQQRTSDTIEEVTDEILQKIIAKQQYVAVFFSGPCEEDDDNDKDECESILQELETLDSECDAAGITLVTTEETDFGEKSLNIKEFPALVMFRNGDPLKFKGDLSDEDEILAWLTDEKTLELKDRIEEVNLKMMRRIVHSQDVVVFFYRANDKRSVRILAELENIDDECDAADIAFVKISDEAMLLEYDLDPLPALVYFRNKFPQIYPGDLSKEEGVLDWVLQLKDSDVDVIEEVDHRTLKMLLDELDHVAVFFQTEGCSTCNTILQELETIDDEAGDAGIFFVKTTDIEVAKELRLKEFPALVYYQGGVPAVYRGDLFDEDKVLHWMRRVYRISTVDDKLLYGDGDDDGYQPVKKSKKDAHKSKSKNGAHLFKKSADDDDEYDSADCYDMWIHGNQNLSPNLEEEMPRKYTCCADDKWSFEQCESLSSTLNDVSSDSELDSDNKSDQSVCICECESESLKNGGMIERDKNVNDADSKYKSKMTEEELRRLRVRESILATGKLSGSSSGSSSQNSKLKSKKDSSKNQPLGDLISSVIQFFK